MERAIFFRKDGKLKSKKVEGFRDDPAKDLGGYSHKQLQESAGIESGAVLVRIK
mgnify:CR=1 FL=1